MLTILGCGNSNRSDDSGGVVVAQSLQPHLLGPIILRVICGFAMWDMFRNWLKLFFQGRLLCEPGQVARQWLFGFVVAPVVFVALVKPCAALGLTVVVVALGAGATQPCLLRNLKYA